MNDEPTEQPAVAGPAAPEESETTDQDPFPFPLDAGGRVGLAVVAIPFALLCAWMFYIVNKCLTPRRTWIEVVVGVILDLLILSVGLFAGTLLLGAVFAPTWLARAFAAAAEQLTCAVAVVVVLFVSAFLILVFVLPSLAWLGIWR